MTWFTGSMLYLLIWWTALFVVLPWGLKHDLTGGPAEHSPGAPEMPQLWRKFMITTVLSGLLWLVFYLIIKADLIDFRSLSLAMMAEDTGPQ